jgi:DNA-binding NarL/FixJ family response regulator
MSFRSFESPLRSAPYHAISSCPGPLAATVGWTADSAGGRLTMRGRLQVLPPSVEVFRADDLTPRELEVLTLIAHGLSNAEICAELVVSAATVKTHINHIFMKTGARDRAQVVRYAYEHGLV